MNDQNEKPVYEVLSYPVYMLCFAAWFLLCGIASALVQYWICDEPFKAIMVLSACTVVAIGLLWMAVAEMRS